MSNVVSVSANYIQLFNIAQNRDLAHIIGLLISIDVVCKTHHHVLELRLKVISFIKELFDFNAGVVVCRLSFVWTRRAGPDDEMVDQTTFQQHYTVVSIKTLRRRLTLVERRWRRVNCTPMPRYTCLPACPSLDWPNQVRTKNGAFFGGLLSIEVLLVCWSAYSEEWETRQQKTIKEQRQPNKS